MSACENSPMAHPSASPRKRPAKEFSVLPTQTRFCGVGQGEGMHSYIPWPATGLFVPRLPYAGPAPRLPTEFPSRVISIGSQAGPRHSPFKRGMRGFEPHPIDQFLRRSLTVEHGSHKPVGEGSIPSAATKFLFQRRMLKGLHP
jgi:hypothetical protein